uniref:Enoyl reductase (ER) domain-containing protein n=1 Tax=Quercus lobata TaxID=97700 RepID=A0A7N2N0X1_QUELO
MSEVSTVEKQTMNTYGWATRDSSRILSPFHFKRRHEIVGEVTKVGHNVTKFKIGDKAGVGLSIPNSLPLHGVAPLLCAGITVYSPMMYYGLCKPGQHLGVVGLGGLGHLAVKFAKVLGTKVTVISTSSSKQKEALERLGVDSFLVSHDQEQLLAAVDTMDGIIDTVSGPHPILPLIDFLKTNGKFIVVSVPIEAPEIPYIPLIMGRKLLGGSGAGGMKETQEMVDFAAKHNIIADVEVISMDYVNTAMERLANGAREERPARWRTERRRRGEAKYARSSGAGEVRSDAGDVSMGGEAAAPAPAILLK